MENEKFKNKYRIKSARAQWHDYSCGDYFITICTAEREHYFGEIVNGEMQLTEIGKYADECVKQIEILHSDVSVPSYVIMPNHIHLIVIVDAVTPDLAKTPNVVVETPYYDVSTTTPRHDVSTTTPHGVSTTTPHHHVPTNKTTTNKTIEKNKIMQSIANKCGRLSHVISRFKSAVTRYANENNISFKWQTRFHDHIIRNQNELNRIAQYIEENPYNWTTDDYY